MLLTLATAAAIAACPPPPARRWHCVHDGDTIWWQGTKVRLADIDTPELDGDCPRERQLAIAARARLTELLNTAAVAIEWTGNNDRYGRPLVRLGGVGQQLVSEGLAHPYGKPRTWCR